MPAQAQVVSFHRPNVVKQTAKDNGHKPALTHDFRENQEKFCMDMIGMGVAHRTMISLILGVDDSALTVDQMNLGKKLIYACKKQLGYGVMDARRVQTPFMKAAVRAASSKYRLKVKFA